MCIALCPVTLRVKDVIEGKVVTIEATRPVADAVKEMASNEVWSLVVTKNGLPVGVVTERDIIRRCYAKAMLPERATVESVMSSPLITIEPEASLGEAMLVMEEKKVRRLFVVEKGKITGRITQTGALGQMLDVMMALSAAA